MKNYLLLFGFILAATIISCKSSKVDNVTTDLSEVKDYLGETFDSSSNKSGTFTLYSVTTDNATVHPRVKFALFNVAENKIVQKGVIRQGYIKWISDSELEKMDLPGVIQDGQTQSDFIKTIKTTQE